MESLPTEKRFRVCPGCGNLTPAERPDCPYCDFNSVEVLVAQQEVAKERTFLQTLFNRTNPFTLIIIGVNVAVFLLEWLAGGMGAVSADHDVIIAFGAKVNRLIIEQHQYWRLFTELFIHIGFLHLLMNNYALWIIGMEIERIYGSARFVILYFLTGLAGSTSSLFFTDAVSAGASGAIFGLFGVMATFAFRFRKEIPDAIGKEMRRRIVPIIAINLIFGFSVQLVDNAAHLGGLASGVLIALIIPYKRPEEKTTPILFRALQYILLALAFVSLLSAFANYDGPKLSFANLRTAPSDRIEDYFEKIEEADSAFVDSLNSFGRVLGGRSNDPQPALDAAERGLNAVKTVPNLQDDRIDQRRARLLEVLTAQKDIIERYKQADGKNRQQILSEEEALIKKAEEYQLIKSDSEPDERQNL